MRDKSYSAQSKREFLYAHMVVPASEYTHVHMLYVLWVWLFLHACVDMWICVSVEVRGHPGVSSSAGTAYLGF